MVGMTKTVTLYRQSNGWRGQKLEGVSVTGGHSRVTVDRRSQTSRRYPEFGESREKQGRVIIPKAAIPAELTVEPGDLILFGEGPKRLKTPSELKEKGREFLRVQSVEDRRQEKILPHIAVTGC